MGYSLDLSKISMDAYKEILKNQYLLPSRKILHQDMNSSFHAMHSCQIKNLAELKNALSTPQKLIVFSEKTGLSKDYLTILRREIGSIEPKTVLLKDFPEVEEKPITSLEVEGLKSSKDFYEFYYSLKDKNEITQKVSISLDKAQELYCLCDLVRINGVGAVAAKSFFDAGYKSVNDVANTTAEEMLERVSNVNGIKQYYKAKLGTKDMQFCIDFASIIKNIENEMTWEGSIFMKYKLPLVVVDDISVSRKFYEEVLNQKVILDFGTNITFGGDFALQSKESWLNFINKTENEILPKANNFELYFEEEKFDKFVEQLGYLGVSSESDPNIWNMNSKKSSQTIDMSAILTL